MPKGGEPILNFYVLNLNFVKDRDYIAVGKKKTMGYILKVTV